MFRVSPMLKPTLFRLLPQDVFRVNLRTATGVAGAVTGGPNLSRGGVVWSKSRSVALYHSLYSTGRGTGKRLPPNDTLAEQTFADTLTAFNVDGFSFGADAGNTGLNSSAASMVDWMFAYASKFCVEVTYTGDGTSERQIPHGLGIAPGMVIIKRRDGPASSWLVYHRSAAQPGVLNSTTAFNLNATYSLSAADATSITLGSNAGNGGATLADGSTLAPNISGALYDAILFAHDPDTTNGIIQCGSFTTDGSGNANIALGWQPQFLLEKRTDASDSWALYDTARGWGAGNDALLFPNLTNAEQTTVDKGTPTASGFSVANHTAGASHIYTAIRAPIT